MTMKKDSNPVIPGSPEDNAAMTAVLQEFFSNRLKAIQMYQETGRIEPASTTGTKSQCHTDGCYEGD